MLAGILILVMPKLLNYIVAVYLIVIGLIGLFGRLRLSGDVFERTPLLVIRVGYLIPSRII